MYLKSIQLQNFRGFSDPQIIEFNDGLNVLVGENDSGKSAIIDAIRIVLGATDQSWYRIELSDFYNENDKFEIKIACKFCDLTADEQAAFLECLSYEMEDGKQLACLYLHWTCKYLLNFSPPRTSTSISSGINGDGQAPTSEARELLRVTYLRPLRDAYSNMQSGRNSRLSQIMMGIPDLNQGVAEYTPEMDLRTLSLTGIADLTNKLLADHLTLKDTNRDISSILTDKMLLKGDGVTTSFEVSGTNATEAKKLSALLEKLDLSAQKDTGKGRVGLGTSNILSMACELLLSRDSISSFLLIEEPEAHIHAQRQLRLIQSLQESASKTEYNHQIILTTHSPLLASVVNLENIIIIKDAKPYPLSSKYTNLEKCDYAFLERYLDATKANLFFAKGVVIIEGVSEELLLPTIAKLLKRDFTEHGISVVNVRGIGLRRYAKIFQRADVQNPLDIKVACITDRDVMPDCAPSICFDEKYIDKAQWPTRRQWKAESDLPTQAAKEEHLNLIKERADGQNVKTFISNNWTFEYNLALSGLADDLIDAIVNVKYAPKNRETRKADMTTTLGEFESAEEKASYIYSFFTMHSTSKAEVEKLLGNVIFDEPRRDVIKKLDSIDIQAFPGSGKTTILVAKLAILAKKWPYSYKGICVLSHTNVAREEIEERLGSTEIGRKLLSYPHYIGTLHSFFNTFIGLPWLRSNGYRITAIDTELALSRRWAKLSYGTRTYLERKHLSPIACESKDYPLTFDIKCSNTSPSYKDVEKCANESFSVGYFTFDEMLYVARYAIRQLRHLPQSIQTRFPVILVDEAQDTSALQLEIIDAAFPDKTLSIVNSFGDCNQAIFQSYMGQEKNHMFPRGTVFTVNSSKRFGNKVAQLADSLSLTQRGMIGECDTYSKNDTAHTIFLFDRQNTSRILPAYAKHILSCFTDQEIQENAKIGCHAVGMVHNKEPLMVTDPHFPTSIVDYWNQYNPSVSGRSHNPRYLIEFYRVGNSAFAQTHDMDGLVEWVSRGLRRYVNMNSHIHLSASSSPFKSMLTHLPMSSHMMFRSSLIEIMSLPISTEAEWNLVVAKIHEYVDAAFEIPHVKNDILKWTIPSAYGDVGNKPIKNNCYHHIDSETGREIDIHLGSIHSVKGRTHLATLVMETFWHDHNIKSILPWLCNEPQKGKCGVRDGMRLKCHYVALTRAKGLICVALPQDLIDENSITKLAQVGWNIVRV